MVKAVRNDIQNITKLGVDYRYPKIHMNMIHEWIYI